MDVKFLAARFQSGKKAVADVMAAKHAYVSFETRLCEAHADLIGFQSKARKERPQLCL